MTASVFEFALDHETWFVARYEVLMHFLVLFVEVVVSLSLWKMYFFNTCSVIEVGCSFTVTLQKQYVLFL
jgi:hypothetical protein